MNESFQLPSQPPAKCVDITTYEKSKLEELEEVALSTNNVRIGAILKPKKEPQPAPASKRVGFREQEADESTRRGKKDSDKFRREGANNMPRVCSAPSDLN